MVFIQFSLKINISYCHGHSQQCHYLVVIG